MTDEKETAWEKGLALDWVRLDDIGVNHTEVEEVEEEVLDCGVTGVSDNANQNKAQLDTLFAERMAGVHRCMSCEDGAEFVPLQAQRHPLDRRTDSAWCSGVCVRVFTNEGREYVEDLKERVAWPEHLECRNGGLGLDVGASAGNATVAEDTDALYKRQESMLGISSLLLLLLGANGVGVIYVSFFGTASAVLNPRSTATEAAKINLAKILGVIAVVTSFVLLTVVSGDDQVIGIGSGPQGVIQEGCAVQLKHYLGFMGEYSDVDSADFR